MVKGRMFLLVVISLLLLGLFGCGGPEQTASDPSASNSEPSSESKPDPQKEEKKAKFPSKPLELVVPYSAGGGTDQVARTFATSASEYTEVPVRVVVMPGSGGAEGTKFIADSEPDGYKVSFGTLGSALTTPLIEDVGYTHEDLEPIAIVTEPSFVIVVNPDAPWNDFKEFVQYMKDNPGKVSYGSSGAGGSAQFGAELLADSLGFEWKHVPFNGSSEAVAQVMGGNIDASFPSTGSSIAQINAGKLKALAVTGSKRLDALPDVPTVSELGYDYVYGTWRGILAPAGIPEEARQFWIDLAKKVTENETFIKLATKLEGEPPAYLGGDDFKTRVQKQGKQFKPIAEDIVQGR
jgi:tripartite-type tricarboxylate transporter receptor subunit TctC